MSEPRVVVITGGVSFHVQYHHLALWLQENCFGRPVEVIGPNQIATLEGFSSHYNQRLLEDQLRTIADHVGPFAQPHPVIWLTPSNIRLVGCLTPGKTFCPSLPPLLSLGTILHCVVQQPNRSKNK